MISYKATLKKQARHLRKNMTESEQTLWSRLRGKQLFGIQFYRQKPLGDYIVDFLAPKTKLVVEVDGSQHKEGKNKIEDNRRDSYLESHGLRVLRSDSRQVLLETDAVVERIFQVVIESLSQKNPPSPPFSKGGN